MWPQDVDSTVPVPVGSDFMSGINQSTDHVRPPFSQPTDYEKRTMMVAVGERVEERIKPGVNPAG